MSPASRAVEVQKSAGAPLPTEYHDPVWLVERAWSSHRLPRLQALICATIAELDALAPKDLLLKDESPERTTRLPDPIIEALRACSEELREASAIAGSQAARAAHCSLVRRYISQQPAAWGVTFTEALEHYRHAACRLLLVALRAESVPNMDG